MSDRGNQSSFQQDKFKELLSCILKSEKTKKIDQLYLHKYLFYLDFIAFARLGHSITGSKYKANKLGPTSTSLVPSVENAIRSFVKVELIQRNNRNPKKSYTLKKSISTDHLSLEEKTLIHHYLPKLLNKDIVDVSHNEPAWLRNYNEKKDKPNDIGYEWANTISFLRDSDTEIANDVVDQWNAAATEHCRKQVHA